MYLKKTWIYKDHIEVRKYHTSRYGVKGEKRQPKEKPSEASVKAANERNAVKKLERLLINNFDHGDWHLVLTYGEEDRPDLEEGRKRLSRFFSRIRKAYRKQGVELKYIAVTEWEAKRIHHHIVINDCPGFSKIISAEWPYGGQHMTPTYQDRNYKGLAAYLVKETANAFRQEGSPYKQRYTCSRNLEKPEETVEVIKAKEWRKEPSVPRSLQAAGYYLEKGSIYEGVDIFGYPFLEYTMVKTERGNRKGNKCS